MTRLGMPNQNHSPTGRIDSSAERDSIKGRVQWGPVIKGGLVIALLFGIYVVGKAINTRVFKDDYVWHKTTFKAETEAGRTNKLLVVIRHDPRTNQSRRFFREVLGDSRVLDQSQDFVWFKEDTNGLIQRQRNKEYPTLRGVSTDGTTTMPHIFIYDSEGKCLDGTVEGATISADAFVKLLEDASKAGEAGDDEDG